MKKVILMAIFFIFLKAKSQNSIPIKVLTNPDKFAYFDTLLNEFNTSWVLDYAEPFNKFGFAKIKYNEKYAYINKKFYLLTPLLSQDSNILKASNDTIIEKNIIFKFDGNFFVSNKLNNDKLNLTDYFWKFYDIQNLVKPSRKLVLDKIANENYEQKNVNPDVYRKLGIIEDTSIRYKKMFKTNKTKNVNETLLNEISLTFVASSKKDSTTAVTGLNMAFNSYLFQKLNTAKTQVYGIGIHLGISTFTHYLKGQSNLKYGIADVGLAYKLKFTNSLIEFFSTCGIGVFQESNKKFNLNNIPILIQAGFNFCINKNISITTSYTGIQYSSEMIKLSKEKFNSNPILVGLKLHF